MEREKQKAIEREQLEILRKKDKEARKISEEEALAVLNPAKSKFVSFFFPKFNLHCLYTMEIH